MGRDQGRPKLTYTGYLGLVPLLLRIVGRDTRREWRIFFRVQCLI